MLTKSKSEQKQKLCCNYKTFRIFSRMTRSTPASSYVRMDSDAKEVSKKSKKLDDRKAEEFNKDKENNKNLTNKEVKEKKSKKKGWKRLRHAALMTCRYIGMGAAHMSPATAYSTPDYYLDPKYWNKSFSPSYKPKVPQQTPHWTSNMMFAGW